MKSVKSVFNLTDSAEVLSKKWFYAAFTEMWFMPLFLKVGKTSAESRLIYLKSSNLRFYLPDSGGFFDNFTKSGH